LKSLFEGAGCAGDLLEDQKARGSKLMNLVCSLPGSPEAKFILVTAHYDKVRAGAGAIDNWTGASLLPSLYETLALGTDRKHTFLFIGFTDEEAGLVGSRAWMAANRKAYAGRITAVVNIDSVASGPLPLYVWTSRAAPALTRPAFAVGKALGIEIATMNADRVGDSDSTPFREHKIPTIDFHSLNNLTLPILHTIDDQLSRVNEDAYKSTYRFLAGYLQFIDAYLAKQAPAGSPTGALK
jgi:Zn-dependent M28 family amino/carboxypeptidase